MRHKVLNYLLVCSHELRAKIYFVFVCREKARHINKHLAVEKDVYKETLCLTLNSLLHLYLKFC